MEIEDTWFQKGADLVGAGQGEPGSAGNGDWDFLPGHAPWLLVILFTQTLVDACPLFRYAMPRVGPAPCRFSSCARH